MWASGPCSRYAGVPQRDHRWAAARLRVPHTTGKARGFLHLMVWKQEGGMGWPTALHGFTTDPPPEGRYKVMQAAKAATQLNLDLLGRASRVGHDIPRVAATMGLKPPRKFLDGRGQERVGATPARIEQGRAIARYGLELIRTASGAQATLTDLVLALGSPMPHGYRAVPSAEAMAQHLKARAAATGKGKGGKGRGKAPMGGGRRDRKLLAEARQRIGGNR